MISETDIVRAVAKTIKESFPAKVYTRSTSEGFERGCFFVEIVSPAVGNIGEEMREDEMSLRVTFFAERNTLEKELWEVKRRLSELFWMELKVNDEFYISLENPLSFSTTTSGNLEMLMDLHFIQDMPEEDEELIEELEVSYREE